MNELLKKIRTVPDFPKPGILFYDVTTLLKDPVTFSEVLEAMAEPFERKKIELVCSIESRGFIFGAALASDLGAGFVPIRKPGKLPWKKAREEYSLEYGKDAIEMHVDAVGKGQRVLLVDDLLATGGTAAAAISLLRKFEADIVGAAFVIELKALAGRQKLNGIEIHSLVVV
ncbi:MAG: adenine phosphoribosyltransferase [Pseudomonadota bacterium]